MVGIMSAIEKKKHLAEEIARILEPPVQEEDEITATEYAEYNGCTRRIAYEQLMKAVKNGIMTKRKILSNRNWPWAFKMIDEDDIHEEDQN